MLFNHTDSRARSDPPRRMPESRAQVKTPTTCLRSPGGRGVALAWLALACVVAAGWAPPDDRKSADPPKIDAQALARMLQSFDKVEVEKHPWGWIRWLMNARLDPKAQMTFGVVQINAGQRNPPHVHPNCEEILYVLSGSCEHQIGKQTVTLRAGDVLRIPAGVPHKARTFEKESMRAVIAYNSGDRQFTALE